MAAIQRLLALLSLLLLASVHAAPPDLTAPGAIAALKTDANASPLYNLTYNLGPTGLRGWMYLRRGYGTTYGQDGTMTDEDRQILVTVASAPGNSVLAVDDLIIGVGWGSGTDPLPMFTSDARKAFGAAITEAEKTENAGILRVKRWRAGVTTDVSFTLPVMGAYSDTAPYNCPKSVAILASARNKLVSQLLANSNFLTSDWKGAVSALALLGGVAPGDPDYNTVQTRLQTYARTVATAGPVDAGLSIWNWGYLGVFLSEYYLATGDANVLPGINQYCLKLAQSQGMLGTFGHGPAILRPDGSGRMSVAGYGPVNSAGTPANLAIIMGKKALLAGSQTVDPQIDAAIQRASDFLAWYVNKGSIPYGEHHPGASDHASNGKDQAAAVFFSQLENRIAETEYFTRMSVAGFPGRECGHTGQGFSYLWEGMATNVGGQLAVSEYFKPLRWHLDLTRRTDGSFAYDGGEQYDAGKTSDGTYLGFSGYYDLNPTACYLLTYSLPLQRLYITGKNANTAHQLDSTKVANAVAAATYKFDRTSRSTTQLIADLSEYDPVVRNLAAQELATRTLTSGELTTLRNMLSGPDANGRMGACQTLGLRKDSTAMTMITQRLDKTIETDPWVRAHAANALRDYGTAANSQVSTMLTRFVDNSADPDTIVWSDPLQASNGMLSFALFDSMPGTSYFDFGATVITAAKNLLYPAVSTGFKQPDSATRQGPANFAFSRMPIGDVQAMPNDFINLVLSETQYDRMWSGSARRAGIRTLSKYKFFETMPLGLSLLDVPTGFEWGSDDYVEQALTEIATYGEAARWTLPTLRGYLNTWDSGSSTHTALVNAINSVEAATTSPAITYLKAAANGQVVTTAASTAKAITLTGSSCREASVSFTVLTQPSNGTLTGTAPNLIYTPNTGYTGPDHFTFRTADTLTTSEPATVGIVVGTAGTGLKGEYFNNSDFTNPVLTRTDAQVNFDWGTGSPSGSIGADTFSVRWSGLLLVPETCAYTFSTLSNDGVRLYINGAPVIDNFVDQNSKWTDAAPIQLTKGQMVEIQMEYYENTGSAAAKLKWTGPQVAGVTGAIIPQAYLFDGSGIPNRTPYAHAQTVSTVVNTAKAVTLTGSGGTLTYAVLTQPANGTLTGTAPYLTYTPAASFSGTDSFTFLVNNGTGNSSPATVSISIAAGLPVTYTWSSAVSANMSTGTSWVGSTAPPAAGLAYANLNFSPTGTYTATHDLNNGFKLNQLNFSGVVTVAGTNSLSFAANGSALPQLNQNSSNAVTVNPPLELTSTTTFGGSYGGKVTLGGLISGSGGLVKTSPGTLQINNFNNTYTGGTILNNGTVAFPAGNGSATPHFGTGPITVNASANFSVNRTVMSNAMAWNGCTISGGNSFSSVLSGPITLNGIVTISMGTTGGLQISGNVSGSGGFTTTGTTQWTMNGSNSYTGPTTIQAGTLRYQAAAAVAPGALNIATGGKANLNYTGNRAIASLTLGGIDMPSGTYGGSSSSATFKNDTYFTSTSIGTVTVLPPTSTSLALTNGSTPANPGTPLTFTATVTGSNPTGNVAFYDNATLLGASALNGSYHASLTTSSLTSGSHNITAQYQGNATNASSTSNATAIVINNTVPSAPANVVATPSNNRVTLTWTASAGADGYYLKRSVTNGGPYTLLGNSSTPSFTDLTAVNGTTYFYVLSAYNGFGEGSNSAQATATPSVQPSSTSVVSSPVGSGTYGNTVTFTATVSVSGATATGSVTFKDGATVLGTGTLSGGVATLNTSTLAVASHSITAAYEGDDTYDSSVSSPMSYTVNPKVLSITGVTADNKVYDGTSTATLTGGAISGGLIGSDVVIVIAGSGAFASANAGTWTVTASGYSLGGAAAGNYALSAQPAVPNATITPRPIQLTGARTYDGTATAQASVLTISNNIDGANLILSGSAGLVSKDAGERAIEASSATLTRVQAPAIGNTTGNNNNSTSITVNLASPPNTGNTLVAVVSTRLTGATGVSISGGGVSWQRVVLSTNTNGVTTEIWYGPNVSNGGQSISISHFATRSAAVVMEYSGLLLPVSLDVFASNTGSGTLPNTGTTTNTSQANQLWLGAIGINSGSPTLDTLSNGYGNGFTSFSNATSTGGSASNNTRIFALERFATSSGAAFTGGTLSASAQWAGAIATFKAASSSNLTLSGPAANNYTLTGMTGAVTIVPKALNVSGLSASNKAYDGTTSATLSGTAALLGAQVPGSGTTSDGKPYTGDTLTLSGTASGTFATKHVGTSKSVAVNGLTLGGTAAGNYSLALPIDMTASITAFPITVAAVNASKTYDGTTTASGTPTINPALATGDTAASLLQSFQTPDAGTGNKILVPAITINDGNNGGNYTITLQNYLTGTISPAIATVILENLTAIYDGSSKEVTIVTSPTGLSTAATYDGSSTAPADAGSYAVAATITDPNFTGTATDTLVITKAIATITLENLTPTYDGAPKSATASTTPAGKAVSLTYDGSSTTPTNAGSYAVAANIIDANYAGTASGTLVIAKAAATVTLGDLSATYDGAPKTVSVGTSPTGLTTSVTYGGSSTPPTNAGSYAVVATVTDANHTGTTSDTLVIIGDSMTTWRSAHFSASEITAGIAEDLSNPDGDEFNNLKEYVMGTDPRNFSPSPLGLTSASGGQITLSFVARAATGSGYAGKTRKYDVQWSSDLSDPKGWHGVDGHTGIVGDGGTVQVTLPVVSPRKFFRLHVRVE